MKTPRFALKASAVVLLSVCAGCATWSDMGKNEKGTAVGATGGALAGAVVGGPVGAAVGAGIGGYAGHYETQPGGIATPNGPGSHVAHGNTSNTAGAHMNDASGNASLVRSVQTALNSRGYSAGQADGQWGPSTESALRQFQQANGMAQTGTMDDRTLSALGVSH